MATTNKTKVFYGPLQLTRGTSGTLESSDHILLEGELWLATDTRKIKAGDGIHKWSELPYIYTGISLARTIIEVTSEMLANKSLTLPEDCNVAGYINVTLQGIQSEKGIDWIVAGRKLQWTGLGFDGFIRTGDRLAIEYEEGDSNE